MKRITNIDTLSALFDRLITERIKLFFFEKDTNVEKALHQKEVIDDIRERIAILLTECFDSGEYDYIGEKRTFDENAITESLEQLILSDILIGEGDRARLREIYSENPNFNTILYNEKLTRKANENRAKQKNLIDKIFGGLFLEWKRR